MGNNTNTYYRLIIEHVNKELEELANDENVKRYITLRSKLNWLYSEQESYIEYSKFCDIRKCKHIFIYNDKSHKRFTCVKCGLTNAVMKRDKKNLLPEEKAMFSYIDDYAIPRKKCLPGIYTNIVCDNNSLVRDTYFDVEDNFPTLSDEETVKCLKKTLKIAKKTMERITN